MLARNRALSSDVNVAEVETVRQARVGTKTLGGLMGLMAAVVALLLMAACGADPTPTPTPTSAPTPTPTPPPSIAITDTTLVRALIAQLPPDEVVCLQSRVGEPAYSALQQRSIFSDGSVHLDFDLTECLSDETVIRVFIGALSHEAGGLSDDTLTCIRGTLGNANLISLLSGPDGDLTQGFGVLTGLLLCLTEEEAERVSITALLGDAERPELTLGNLRCLAERVDLTELQATIESLTSAAELPPLDLIATLIACGITLPALPVDALPTGPLPDATLPPDLELPSLECVEGVLGEEAIAAIIAGERGPSLDELQRLLAECANELPQGLLPGMS